MSVPQSERRQSNVEYIVKLQLIEQFFIEYHNNEKTRIMGLTDELVRLSIKAYNDATLYFEICNGRVLGNLSEKKKVCKRTYWDARELGSQINILVAFRMKDNKNIKGLLIKTKDLLEVCELLRKQLTELNKIKE